MAGPPLSARRHLGRQRRELRAVFGACRKGRALSVRSHRVCARRRGSHLPEYTDEVWHVYLPDARPDLLYGYRVYGPYDPANGHRFNPNKLLIDPYAKSLHGRLRWADADFGYRFGGPREDLAIDRRDNARYIPKCRVVEPAFTWGEEHRPQTRWEETIILELSVRGITMRHPGDRSGASRHLCRPRLAGDDRLPGRARRHRGRAVADPCRGRRASTGRSRAGQLLGLQHDRLFCARPAPAGDGLDRRFQDGGQAAARCRDRGVSRRRLQPQRRGQPSRPDPVVSRHRQRILLPARCQSRASIRTSPAPGIR